MQKRLNFLKKFFKISEQYLIKLNYLEVIIKKLTPLITR